MYQAVYDIHIHDVDKFTEEIYKIMYDVPEWRFFGHEWGDSPMIFTSDAVTSENHWRIVSLVPGEALLAVNYDALFHFLHAIYALSGQKLWIQTSIAYFATNAEDRQF